jgi:hypothetical protein
VFVGVGLGPGVEVGVGVGPGVQGYVTLQLVQLENDVLFALYKRYSVAPLLYPEDKYCEHPVYLSVSK